MNPKPIWGGLVLTTAALFAIAFAAQGAVVLAVVAGGLGMLWLAANANELGTLFFVGFTLLAMIAALDGTWLPLTLLGMCANLAAWDLARFRVRLAGQKEQALLKARHLRLLAVVTGAGFLTALVPVLVHVTIPFVMLSGIVLLTLLMLYLSTQSLWGDLK